MDALSFAEQLRRSLPVVTMPGAALKAHRDPELVAPAPAAAPVREIVQIPTPVPMQMPTAASPLPVDLVRAPSPNVWEVRPVRDSNGLLVSAQIVPIARVVFED